MIVGCQRPYIIDFETITCKGLQFWQQLPEKVRTSSPLVSLSRTLSCRKTLNAHAEFAKRKSKDWDSYKKNIGSDFAGGFFYYY